MSDLHELRNSLAVLRGRRRQVRWGTAYVALGCILLWALAAVFGLDVAFHLSVIQRLALFVVAIGCVVWGAFRHTLPFLGVRESEASLALLVESQHGIDTDLVAALQFSGPEAATWGSRQLEEAVISRVADRMPQLDVMRTLRYDVLSFRFKMLVGTLVGVIVVAAIYPEHLRVFADRLLLSSRHYPSDTNIESIVINGQFVFRSDPINRSPQTVNCPQGRPVHFFVQATGKLPENGLVECFSEGNAGSRALTLRPLTPAEFDQLRRDISRATSRDSGTAPIDSKGQWFLAILPQLLEEFQYSVRLGDTGTDLGTIRIIALPIAEVGIQVSPPDYVRAAEIKSPSSRHLAVLEGSRVTLSVRSVNEKELRDVTARLLDAGQTSEVKLTKQDRAGLVWQLDSPNSPLQRIEHEIRYEIQVVDTDGMELESPLHGVIQLTPDRLPTATAQTVHRIVLPGARPVVEFRVSDDYGIQAIHLIMQVQRKGSEIESVAGGSAPTKVIEVPFQPRPWMDMSAAYRGRYELDLSPFQLSKGDQLKLTLEAIDFRGSLPGRSYLTEPLLLEVSDEAGVLAAISEADELSERQLGETIEKQLGVEKAP